MALHTHLDRVTRFAGAEYPGPRWPVVTPRGAGAEVVDESGRVRLGATARSICPVAWTRSSRSARR